METISLASPLRRGQDIPRKFVVKMPSLSECQSLFWCLIFLSKLDGRHLAVQSTRNLSRNVGKLLQGEWRGAYVKPLPPRLHTDLHPNKTHTHTQWIRNPSDKLLLIFLNYSSGEIDKTSNSLIRFLLLNIITLLVNLHK